MMNTTIQDLRRTWLESEKRIHQFRKLRFMKSRASAPRPFQRVMSGGLRSPLSYRLVQTIVGMICKDRPTYKRIPLDDKDRDAASRLQASADPMMQDLERLARKPLYYHFVDNLVADGRAVMKCYQDVWKGFPAPSEEEDSAEYNRRVADFIMRGATHPLRMKIVDPLNFKMPLTEYEPPYVLEQGRRSTVDTCNAFGLRIGPDKRMQILPESTSFHYYELPSGVAPTVDVEELWMEDTVFLRVMGQVFKAENELGFIPYVYAGGETSSHPDPSLQNLSVLYPYAGIEPWLNTMLSVLAAWGVIGGTPIMYTSRKIPPGMAGAIPEAPPNLSDIPLGKRIDLGLGGEIGFVEPPAVGREVLEFIKFLTDFMDRAGLPSLAYGNIGTRTPGTAFQGALEQAIARVNPITTSAENAFADMVKMEWRIVERLDKPMVVSGIGIQPKALIKRKTMGRYIIDPRDINQYYDLHAKIRVGNTQDLIARGSHAAFMKAHKLWSRDRAMEYADVDDTWQEYKDIMRDTLEESPLVQQITLMDALQQEPEIAKRAQALQAQGIDVMSMLTGQPAAPGAAFAAGSTAVAPGAGGAAGNVPGPAPQRGGRPGGVPKNPGGNRGGANLGSRGHR